MSLIFRVLRNLYTIMRLPISSFFDSPQPKSHRYNYRYDFALKEFEKVKILVAPKKDKKPFSGCKESQKNTFLMFWKRI